MGLDAIKRITPKSLSLALSLFSVSLPSNASATITPDINKSLYEGSHNAFVAPDKNVEQYVSVEQAVFMLEMQQNTLKEVQKKLKDMVLHTKDEIRKKHLTETIDAIEKVYTNLWVSVIILNDQRNKPDIQKTIRQIMQQRFKEINNLPHKDIICSILGTCR